jgi:hypothetical protein
VACGKKYHATCHRYRLYKEKVNLKRKYEEGSDYTEGMATTTVKQNRLIATRGPTDLQQSRKTQTILPTYQEDRCHFRFNVTCGAVDGAWFLSKKDQGESILNIHKI